MRGWMEDRAELHPAGAIGDVMRARARRTGGRVAPSRTTQTGDFVHGHARLAGVRVRRARRDGAPQLPPGTPLTWPLGVLGITGAHRLLRAARSRQAAARARPCVVSGAAGATGSVAGQIAKLKGCRVVGIAGGAEKCRWLVRAGAFRRGHRLQERGRDARLRELCPEGIDVFFDNVGGAILDAALDAHRGARAHRAVRRHLGLQRRASRRRARATR